MFPINNTWPNTAYTFNLVSLYIEKSLYQKYKRNDYTWKTFLNNDPCLKNTGLIAAQWIGVRSP